MSADTSKSSLLKYNPQLDGLRFYAVLIVICFHWLPSVQQAALHESVGLTVLINFFFVLSSYLITRILLTAKEKSVEAGITKLKVVSFFLIRRTLRIFPAYYLYLILLLFLPRAGVEIRENAGMYFGYLANFRIFNSGVFPPATTHLWTLSVEEQFYLAWPWVILFVPNKHLLKTFFGITIFSVLLRAYFYYPGQNIPIDIITPFCLDSFALGGILAFKYTASPQAKTLINKYLNIALYCSLAAGVVLLFLQSSHLSFVFNKLIVAFLSVKIIDGAINGYKYVLGSALDNRVVLYLGKISYGIYLYHLIVPILFKKLFMSVTQYLYVYHNAFFTKYKIGFYTLGNVLASEWFSFFVYFTMAVGLASLSWHLLEKPISKIKMSFNYSNSKRASQISNSTHIKLIKSHTPLKESTEDKV